MNRAAAGKQFDQMKADIEAGLVFAAAAIEYQWENPARAEVCRAEAEDCHANTRDILRQGGLSERQQRELRTRLNELQEWIELSRPTTVKTFAAA